MLLRSCHIKLSPRTHKGAGASSSGVRAPMKKFPRKLCDESDAHRHADLGYLPSHAKPFRKLLVSVVVAQYPWLSEAGPACHFASFDCLGVPAEASAPPLFTEQRTRLFPFLRWSAVGVPSLVKKEVKGHRQVGR